MSLRRLVMQNSFPTITELTVQLHRSVGCPLGCLLGIGNNFGLPEQASVEWYTLYSICLAHRFASFRFPSFRNQIHVNQRLWLSFLQCPYDL